MVFQLESQRTENTEPQVNTLINKLSVLIWEWITSNQIVGQRLYMINPKEPRLFPKL